jgi:hypothetical protein
MPRTKGTVAEDFPDGLDPYGQFACLVKMDI